MEDGSGFTKRNVPGLTEKLEKSRVGIAGCGGIGSNVAVYLARSGVGSLVIADFDRVEESNLNRQNYYRDDLGCFKTEATTRYLRNINPSIRIECHNVAVDDSNIGTIFRDCDVIVEAFDKASSKIGFINAASSKFPDTPLVSANGMAGIGDTDGMVARKVGDNLFVCGDGVSDQSMGIMAPRVAVCAGIMANKVLQILADKA